MPEDLARLIAAESILTNLFFHRAVHFVLTMIMFWMAFIFLDSYPSFRPEVHVYDFMKRIMDESGWGVACLVAAMLGSATGYTMNWRVRVLGAAMLSACHFILFICTALGTAHAPSVGLLCASSVLGAALAFSTANIGRRFEERVDPSRIQGPLAR